MRHRLTMKAASRGKPHPARTAQAGQTDLLVQACWCHDLPSAEAAIAEGADVNALGKSREGIAMIPLLAAVAHQHVPLVTCLLAHGADPNGNSVMYFCTASGMPDLLRLLIAAGGDVNRASSAWPLLFLAVRENRLDSVHVLLGQPTLDLAATHNGMSPEQFARDLPLDRVAVTSAIEHEVMSRCGGGVPQTLLSRSRRLWLCVCVSVVTLPEV